MKRLELLNEFKNNWVNCTKCPLSELRKQVVFGSGNIDAKLVMIGEAPGEDEDNGGLPFIGKAGKVFDWILKDTGIKREELWITNTCLCRPKISLPGKNNRAPKLNEIRACYTRLLQELDIIKPEIIVLAGNIPLYMATGARGITKKRGWQETKWIGGTFSTDRVFATLHPASLLYGSKEQKEKKADWLKSDWLEIARIFLGKKKR
jgi:DNA polymerase